MRCHARKGGGFIAQRHDTIRDRLTSHISKMCRDLETEPLRHSLENEVFNLHPTVISREARLDMKAGGFWTPGVTAFFDVRVTHVTSRSNQAEHTATIFKQPENEKKWKYNQRVTDVEMATFTPLVFGTDGAWYFFRTLASKLLNKNNEPYASVSWLRIQLPFAILRTVYRCIRGSRYSFESREVSVDFTLAVARLHVCSYSRTSIIRTRRDLSKKSG